MNIKAVIFDMDGTVLDTLADLNSAANHVLALFHLPKITIDQTKHYIGNGSRRYLEMAAPPGTGKDTIEKMLEVYLPYYNEHANVATAPYDGISAMIRSIRAAGYKTAIVSNKPDKTVKQLTGIFFPGLFDAAAGENESEGILRKPDPAMLIHTAENLGVSLDTCLYVGDSETDIETARRANCRCASVLWGFRTKETLENAGGEMFFSSPDDLREALLLGVFNQTV